MIFEGGHRRLEEGQISWIGRSPNATLRPKRLQLVIIGPWQKCSMFVEQTVVAELRSRTLSSPLCGGEAQSFVKSHGECPLSTPAVTEFDPKQTFTVKQLQSQRLLSTPWSAY